MTHARGTGAVIRGIPGERTNAGAAGLLRRKNAGLPYAVSTFDAQP